MQKTRSIVAASALTALAILSTGCGNNTEEAKNQTAAPQTETPAWQLASAPTGALDVAAAKANITVGEPITLRGKIGGRKAPVTAESGVFVLMDPALPSCADNPGDGCKTPWDYCCETPETITQNAATVQLRDAQGQPITLDEHAIHPLQTVVVTGTIAPGSGETLIVHAKGIYNENAADPHQHDDHTH